MSLHLKVTGIVQGVGFRQFVQSAAERLELEGWVRNTDDGGLEVMVNGPVGAEQALFDAVRRGPRNARVDNVQVIPQNGVVYSLPFPFTVQF
jgi:acylphosphatase